MLFEITYANFYSSVKELAVVFFSLNAEYQCLEWGKVVRFSPAYANLHSAKASTHACAQQFAKSRKKGVEIQNK